MQSISMHRLAALSLALATASVAAHSVKLPPLSRTVYKCTVEGKTLYSDSPCVGAQSLEIEPTRGMDSMTGRPQSGTDVRRERQREALAEAVKPLTGTDAKGFEKDRRRLKLAPATQRECAALDGDLQAQERAEREAQPRDLPQAQQSLYATRKRFRELGC